MNSAESSDASDGSCRKDPTKQSPLQDGSTNPTPQPPSHDLTSEMPHNQQEVEPTTLSSAPPTATDGCHPVDTQGNAPSATVAGSTVLPMDPSELAALRQATRHLVQLPRVHRTPVEEHRRDHSAAVLLSGRSPLVPDGLPVLVGDGLFMDWTAVPCSVTRKDDC